MSPELATGLVAIGSAFIGALPGLISNFLNREADDKKQIRELIMNTAAENWRFIAQNAQVMLPFEHYMIHTALMCDFAFLSEEITEERTAAQLTKVAAVLKVLEQHAKSRIPRKHAT